MTELYAFHDDSGLDYQGYIVLTRGIGRDPDDRNGENFRLHPQVPVVRLNHGYHPHGTIPQPQHYEAFAQRVRNFVEMSPGCSRWIIGNEPNHAQERPDGMPILPAEYAECYSLCRDAIKGLPYHSGDQVLVAAVAPWNVQTTYALNPAGNWIRYFDDVQFELGPGECDGFAIHTYAREQTPESIVSLARMDPPFEMYHSGFRTYTDWMNAILPRFQGLPVYLTEFCIAGVPWENENTGCVQAAYQDIDRWNALYPDRPISCLALYRWAHDQWAIYNRPAVQADFFAATTHGYAWPREPEPEPPEEDNLLLNPSFEQPYHAHLGTVKVADGWDYFHKRGDPPHEPNQGPCAMPEYKPLPASLDARRVVDGDTAQCWFLNYKVMDAGIYQRVPVEHNHWYQFSVSAQAWCSNSDDPAVSDGEMYLSLGIDPRGKEEPFELGVVWQPWAWVGPTHERFYSLPVRARDDHITVYVRSWNKWRLKHNDVYVDAASLTEIDVCPDQPDPGPGPTECQFSEAAVESVVRRVVVEELERRVWAPRIG